MKNLTSDCKKYKCICQKTIIKASELKSHIRKDLNHKLTKAKEKKKFFVEDQHQINNVKVIKSSSLLSLQGKNYIFNKIISSTIMLCFLNSKIEIIYRNSTEIFQIDPLRYSLPDHHYKHQIADKIIKLSLPIIKEITLFKYEKIMIKSKFNLFLENRSCEIWSMCLSKDKLILMSGGSDGKVRLWDPQSLEQRACLKYHRSPIYALDIDGSSNYGLSGSTESAICLWNLKSKKLKIVFKGHEYYISFLKFTENSKFFISGSYDCSLRIWSIIKKSLVYLIKATSWVQFVSINIHRSQFTFICYNGEITNIDLKTSTISNKRKFRSLVICSELSDEGNILVTGHGDGYVQFINTKGIILLKSYKYHLQYVNSINYCSHSKIFATCSNDRTIGLWSAINYKILKFFKYPSFNVLYYVIISSFQLYIGGSCPGINLIDYRTQQNIAKMKLKNYDYSLFTFSLDNKWIAYANQNIFLYSLDENKDINSRPIFGMTSMMFINSAILCGTCLSEIYVLNSPYLNIIRRFRFDNGPILFITASNDWKHMAYSIKKNNITNRTLIVRHLESSKVILNFSKFITAVKFCSNCFILKEVVQYGMINLYIFNYEKIANIGTFNGSQIYLSKLRNFIILKNYSSRLTLIELENQNKSREAESFKGLNIKEDCSDFRMSKQNLQLLSLEYSYTF